MMNNLNGKVAIVTGGARDIGGECSLKLSQLGASVCINYNKSREQAEEVLGNIIDSGGETIIVNADVTDSGEVKAMIEKCKNGFGEEIHILVNNAGGIVARKTMQKILKSKLLIINKFYLKVMGFKYRQM